MSIQREDVIWAAASVQAVGPGAPAFNSNPGGFAAFGADPAVNSIKNPGAGDYSLRLADPIDEHSCVIHVTLRATPPPVGPPTTPPCVIAVTHVDDFVKQVKTFDVVALALADVDFDITVERIS